MWYTDYVRPPASLIPDYMIHTFSPPSPPILSNSHSIPFQFQFQFQFDIIHPSNTSPMVSN